MWGRLGSVGSEESMGRLMLVIGEAAVLRIMIMMMIMMILMMIMMIMTMMLLKSSGEVALLEGVNMIKRDGNDDDENDDDDGEENGGESRIYNQDHKDDG